MTALLEPDQRDRRRNEGVTPGVAGPVFVRDDIARLHREIGVELGAPTTAEERLEALETASEAGCRGHSFVLLTKSVPPARVV